MPQTTREKKVSEVLPASKNSMLRRQVAVYVQSYVFSVMGWLADFFQKSLAMTHTTAQDPVQLK
jgi:hypothetical protein